MARAAHEGITLPWRETVDGAVAELGAVFRVELVGGKWQCSAKDGACRTVIATELSSRNEAKRRAEAHAATMPNVRPAEKSRQADAKPGTSKTTPRRSSKVAEESATPPRARAPRSSGRTKSAAVAKPVAPEPPESLSGPEAQPSANMTTLGVTYQPTADGCLCGKTQGVCWVANGDEVVFAKPPPKDIHDRVRDAVMQHYATTSTPRQAAEKAEREAAARLGRKQAAAQARASKTGTPRDASARRRQTVKKAAAKKATAKKPAAKKPAAKKAMARKATAKKATAEAAAKEVAPTKRDVTGKGPRAATPIKEVAPAKDAPPTVGRKASCACKDKPNGPKEDAPVTVKAAGLKARAEKLRQPAPLPAAIPSGPLTWSEVEGKPRGVAAHGTFLIEPEGQSFGLYFTDPGGQSRHLRSGAEPELRRAAQEYAARGEPAPLRDAPSREQDEALMRIFASGAGG